VGVIVGVGVGVGIGVRVAVAVGMRVGVDTAVDKAAVAVGVTGAGAEHPAKIKKIARTTRNTWFFISSSLLLLFGRNSNFLF